MFSRSLDVITQSLRLYYAAILFNANVVIVLFYVAEFWMKCFQCNLNCYWGILVDFFVKVPMMTDKVEEPMEVGENPSPEKVKSQPSLLDSGEDFELLDEDDIGDEPPPLEDTGGGKEKSTEDPAEMTSDTTAESQAPLEEWLDVLGR